MITLEQAAAVIAAKNECVQLEKAIKWFLPKPLDGDAVQLHLSASLPNSIYHDVGVALGMTIDQVSALLQNLLLKELQERLVNSKAKLDQAQNPFPGESVATEETF